MGMISEPHLAGSEFGELQSAIWTKQFQALRDGDRFFYGNDTARLNLINTTFGIDYRRTLAQVITANTDITAADIPANVFKVAAGTPLDQSRILGIRSARCLDVPASNQTNGTPVQIFDCNATTAQGWQQVPATRAIRAFTNKCLDVAGHGTANGTPVQIWDCTAGRNQQWTFNANGTIVGAESNKCLDVRLEGNNANGTRLQIWDCNGGTQQRFIR
jgi:hypothetical protein